MSYPSEPDRRERPDQRRQQWEEHRPEDPATLCHLCTRCGFRIVDFVVGTGSIETYECRRCGNQMFRVRPTPL